MLKKTLLAALIGFPLSLATHAAWAASFDCDRATAADEKTVCAHRALNDMDVSMALLYSLDKKFLPMGGRDDLIGQQKAWLKSRSACAANVACLSALYEQRIQVLRQIIDTRVVTHGPF